VILVPIDIHDPMAVGVTVGRGLLQRELQSAIWMCIAVTAIDNLFILGILSMPFFLLLLFLFCSNSCFQSLKQIDTVLERACCHRKDVSRVL
jgi:hypothetical protein